MYKFFSDLDVFEILYNYLPAYLSLGWDDEDT